MTSIQSSHCDSSLSVQSDASLFQRRSVFPSRSQEVWASSTAFPRSGGREYVRAFPLDEARLAELIDFNSFDLIRASNVTFFWPRPKSNATVRMPVRERHSSRRTQTCSK